MSLVAVTRMFSKHQLLSLCYRDDDSTSLTPPRLHYSSGEYSSLRNMAAVSEAAECNYDSEKQYACMGTFEMTHRHVKCTRLRCCTVEVREVAALAHEARDDPVEGAALV